MDGSIVAEEQVAPNERRTALAARKRALLCVRSLMTATMLAPTECTIEEFRFSIGGKEMRAPECTDRAQNEQPVNGLVEIRIQV